MKQKINYWIGLILACLMFFAVGMMVSAWHYNKYEVKLSMATMVAPQNVAFHARRAANHWDEFCKVRPDILRQWADRVNKRDLERIKKRIEDSKLNFSIEKSKILQ